MKKTILSICSLFILILSLTACTANSADAGDDSDYLATIASLESQLASLREGQSATESENKKKIDELTALISKLESSTEGQGVTSDSEAEPTLGYKYTLRDGNAVITGYVGNDENLVIPASIDGYRVLEIADSAFANLSLKSVIISNGIERIGWFAFDGCTRLSTITVPSTVSSIGYCALGNAESSLTVLCHSGSFALEYAKSYGLAYAII